MENGTYTNKYCREFNLKDINDLSLCGPAMTFDRKIITPKNAKGDVKFEGRFQFEYDVNVNEKFDTLLTLNNHKSNGDLLVNKLDKSLLLTL